MAATADSPSGAAVAVVGHEMNGWTFWGFQSGDGTLVPLADLRKRLEPRTDEEAVPPPEQAPVETEKEEEPKEVGVKSGSLKALVDAGVIPVGATVFANFKGGRREATVDACGRLHLDDGSVHKNPSGAARRLTGYESNGWNFWRLELGGKTVSLKALRDKNASEKPAE